MGTNEGYPLMYFQLRHRAHTGLLQHSGESMGGQLHMPEAEVQRRLLAQIGSQGLLKPGHRVSTSGLGNALLGQGTAASPGVQNPLSIQQQQQQQLQQQQLKEHMMTQFVSPLLYHLNAGKGFFLFVCLGESWVIGNVTVMHWMAMTSLARCRATQTKAHSCSCAELQLRLSGGGRSAIGCSFEEGSAVAHGKTYCCSATPKLQTRHCCGARLAMYCNQALPQLQAVPVTLSWGSVAGVAPVMTMACKTNRFTFPQTLVVQLSYTELCICCGCMQSTSVTFSRHTSCW